MKIILLYTRVVKKWDESHPEHKSYSESSERFIRTYKQFKPELPHELLVVNCGGPSPDALFDGVATRYVEYNGGGYDCGTYQAIGKDLDCDLIMGLNTHTHFWRSFWLEPFVESFKVCGPGVYGASASFENFPHLRTPAIGFSPKVIAGYPVVTDTRLKAVAFEAGPENFSLWSLKQGYPTCLVAVDGTYPLEDSQKIANGFRNGDQSNCLIRDRHTDLWQNAGPEERARLTKAALGLQ